MAYISLMNRLENASFNILLHIFFKGITFVINAWALRNVGHEVLGIMNVRLLLLESTILFLSREPFNKACMDMKDKVIWRDIFNQIWLSVPVSCVLSLVFVYIWLNFLPLSHPEHAIQYQFACWSVALSCVLELCCANLTLVAQLFSFIKLKVALDTLQILIRTVLFMSIVVYDKSLALMAFSVAEVGSVGFIALSYYIFFHWFIKNKTLYMTGPVKNKLIPEMIVVRLYDEMEHFHFTSIKDFLPKYSGSVSTMFNKKLSTLTYSFAKQGMAKQILTNGEKYVMSVSSVMTFTEQATYDVVNNLGSLAAWFIFRPIEDSSYFYFTQTVNRDVPLSTQDQTKIQESCCKVLSRACKIVCSLGLILLVFGHSYARTLLTLYGGESFVASGLPVQLLRSHILAIVLFAINGLTECYAFAIMTRDQLNIYNHLIVLFSVSFFMLSYVLTYIFGPVSFIISNCINFFVRIFLNLHFINSKYKGTDHKPLEGLYVGKIFLMILFIAGCLRKLSENKLSQDFILLHITVGALLLICGIVSWGYENLELVTEMFQNTQKKQDKVSLD